MIKVSKEQGNFWKGTECFKFNSIFPSNVNFEGLVLFLIVFHIKFWINRSNILHRKVIWKPPDIYAGGGSSVRLEFYPILSD